MDPSSTPPTGLTSSATHSLVDERATTPLRVPDPPFLQERNSLVSNFDSVQSRSPANSIFNPSSSLNPLGGVVPDVYEKAEADSGAIVSKSRSKRNGFRFVFIILSALVLVILAVVLGVYFGVIRHRNKPTNTSAQSGGSPSSSSPDSIPSTTSSITYGGDGTVVTTENGSTFTYNNKFGGYFVVDPNNPFNNDARAQSWSPPLNQSWKFGSDQVLGVNLGGWLVIEPFITPSLYQKYTTAIDEWTLSTAMAADTESGGINQLEEHYKTFITEEDFAQIAGAGLNWVRLPIAYWAIDTWVGEPFLPKVSWTYALKAFEWARKYGLRILLDLHAAPGSQNGYNHSGQSGKVNFLNGVMGIANAQRLLHYIRIFTEFISQPQYKDVIVMFGIVNEPTGMPMDPVWHFYVEAHNMIRSITGVGEGNGPYISIQGGSPELPTFTGADRIAVEQHPYYAFNSEGSEDVVPYILSACNDLGPMMNTSQRTYGVTTAGEWSLGFNDCGLMLHSTADDHSTQDCTTWDHWETWTPEIKQNVMSFAMSNMDALQNFFFWTWKIGPSATDGMPRSPLWSYQLGVQNGWIPLNPRDAFGHCASLGVAQDSPFDGTYEPYQTGQGDGVIDPSIVAAYGLWPPASIGVVADAALLPTYTATGPVPTLPTQTFPTPTPVDGGDGWYNDADTSSGIITVSGCPYPNAWDATAVPVPVALCTGT